MICNKPLNVLPGETPDKAKTNHEENGKKPLATQEANKAVLLKCRHGNTQEAASEGCL